MKCATGERREKKKKRKCTNCLHGQGGFQLNTMRGCVELLSGPPIREGRKRERKQGARWREPRGKVALGKVRVHRAMGTKAGANVSLRRQL